MLAAEMRIAFQLDRQEIGARIEPDDELRALALDGLGEAVGEVRRRDGGHALRVLPSKDGEGRETRPSRFLEKGLELAALDG
jgi:hypothetical protein